MKGATDSCPFFLCNSILFLSSENVNVVAALSQVGLTATSPFSEANVTKVYKQFYPGENPSTGITSLLVSVRNKAVDINS